MKKHFDIYINKTPDEWKKIHNAEEQYGCYVDEMDEWMKHPKIINLKK
mgnify:CR=1 FL=1